MDKPPAEAEGIAPDQTKEGALPTPTLAAESMDSGKINASIGSSSGPENTTITTFNGEPSDVVSARHTGRVYPDIQSIGQAFLAGQNKTRIRLSEQLQFDIEVLAYEQSGPGHITLTARLPADPNSRIILSRVGEAHGGSLQLPGSDRYYEIRNGSTPGSIIIDSVDLNNLDPHFLNPRKPETPTAHPLLSGTIPNASDKP